MKTAYPDWLNSYGLKMCFVKFSTGQAIDTNIHAASSKCPCNVHKLFLSAALPQGAGDKSDAEASRVRISVFQFPGAKRENRLAADP
jgi:hypothetical protein